MVKLWISEGAQSKRLIEFLGIISRPDVSSTNLIRRCQSDSSLFVTLNTYTPSNIVKYCHLKHIIKLLYLPSNIVSPARLKLDP